MARRALPISIAVALALAATALALRVIVEAPPGGGVPGPGGGTTTDRPATELLPLLFTAAGLCVAGLLRHRAPAGAWLATVTVGGIAALVIVGAVRVLTPRTEVSVWPWLSLLALSAVLAAAAIAGAYATRGHSSERERAIARGQPARPGRAWPWERAWRMLVVGAFAAVALIGAWAAGELFATPTLAAEASSSELPPLRINARLAAIFIAVMALVGMGRDLSGPIGRARTRAGSVRELPRAITEELLPNTSAARRDGRDEERARIAADLHALVLPDLRRAAQAATAAEPETAADLRQALEGVERLMHQRQSIVLEEYGLVAALEWLAERTQQRGGIEVDIELDGADVGDRRAVAPATARAAFRVALLALDNVVRHAGASRVLVRLDVEGGRGRLGIVDDGRGIEDASAPPPGRGLIDMRTAAREVGAALEVERRDGGTAIEMTWVDATSVADQPATRSADLTARRTTRHA